LVIGMNMVSTETVEEQDTILQEQVEDALPFQPSMPAAPADAPVEEAPVEGMPESVE
jgi:hypothetical protein